MTLGSRLRKAQQINYDECVAKLEGILIPYAASQKRSFDAAHLAKLLGLTAEQLRIFLEKLVLNEDIRFDYDCPDRPCATCTYTLYW